MLNTYSIALLWLTWLKRDLMRQKCWLKMKTALKKYLHDVDWTLKLSCLIGNSNIDMRVTFSAIVTISFYFPHTTTHSHLCTPPPKPIFRNTVKNVTIEMRETSNLESGVDSTIVLVFYSWLINHHNRVAVWKGIGGEGSVKLMVDKLAIRAAVFSFNSNNRLNGYARSASIV